MIYTRKRSKKRKTRASCARKEVLGFRVRSNANGTLTVEPAYRAAPLEPGATPVGVLTRVLLAREVEAVLNAYLEAKP